MTYIVYADVLFLYHSLINLALLLMIQAMLGHAIRITHTVLWAMLMAAFSTGIFLITVHLCTLYYILYAISYFFMTYFFIKTCRIQKSKITILSVTIVGCIWLAGMLQAFHIFTHNGMQNPRFYIACVCSIVICRIFRTIYDNQIIHKNSYEINLTFSGTDIHANAFMDTGNQLYNPYSQKPAIVLNYRLLKNCLSEESYQNLEHYHRTGQFPFSQKNGQDAVVFFPLPYHTIGNRFAFMPAVTIEKLTYCKEHTTYYAVTAGISREPFLDNRYTVLLHEKLQP